MTAHRARRTYLGAAAFLVVAAMMLVGAGSLLGVVGGGHGTAYHAVFSNSNGLLKGSPVRAVGIEVGRVTDVRLRSDNTVDVTFTAADIALSDDTHAAIRFRSLTGSKYVELTDPATGGARLKAGDMIPLARTDIGADLDGIFNSFRPLLQGLDTSTINELSGSLIAIFEGRTGDVDLLLSRVASVVTTLAKRHDDIDGLITDLDIVLTSIDSRGSELNATVRSLRKLVRALTKSRRQLVDTAASVSDLVNDGAHFVRKTRPALRAAVKQTGRAASAFNSDLPLMNRYLGLLPEVVDKFGRAASFGSFYGLYPCGFSAKTSLPGGGVVQFPLMYDSSPRCQWPDEEGDR